MASVRERPDREYRSGGRPGQHGESDPFDDLAEIVGRGYVTEHAALRQVVVAVARLAQAADDPVGVDVDGHSCEKDQRADDELRRQQPLRRVVAFRSYVKDPAALHQSVQYVERHAHQHDPERHRATPFQQQRVDERPVQVVELEQPEKDQTYRIAAARGAEAEDTHGDENRGFHRDPAEPVVDFRTPFPVAQHAVPGPDEKQRDENHDGQRRHPCQKEVVIV